MYAHTRTLTTIAAAAVLVLFGGALTDGGWAFAEPLSFDFTFTCDETVKVAATWDTVRFQAALTNTGTEADSYLVSLAENPPTPEDWWREFCAGGVCPIDSLVTSFKIFNGDFLPPLPPGQTDSTTYLDVIPRSVGQGNFTLTIESLSSPGVKLSRSLTFLLSAHERYAPVTNTWGLIVLATLIIMSALYLMYRRLKPVRQT